MINKEKHENKFSRIYSSSILIFLYFLQGLVIGLLLETMQMNLKANFNFSEIGIFLLCSYPFSLKVFWSPIVDTYYINFIGLRKTWIILTQTIAMSLLFYLHIHIDEILDNKQIVFLSTMCFLLMFCISTQDIAVDGWALTLCGKENCSLASSCQTIGQILGIFVSTSIYINLHHYGLLSLSLYFKIISIVFFIATTIVFFIKEYRDFEDHSEGLIQTFHRIKKMTKNRHLKRFLGIMLISNIGNIFFNKILKLILIEKGFSQELLTNISTILIPFELVISYYFSNIKNNFLTKYLYGYKNIIFVYFIELLFVLSYGYISKYEYIIGWIPIVAFLILLSFINVTLSLMSLSGLNGFFHKISDNTIGATYITALNSCNNLAQKWPGVIIFSLVDYIGYELVGIFSLIYCVIFYFLFKENLREIEKYDEEVWKISSKKDVEIKSS